MNDLEKGQQDLIDTLLAQNAALKAELETWRIDSFTYEGRADEYKAERDRCKAAAEKLAEALKDHVHNGIKEGCTICRVLAVYAKTEE